MVIILTVRSEDPQIINWYNIHAVFCVTDEMEKLAWKN